MLTWTFCHLRGLRRGTEAMLWRRGIHTWADAELPGALPFSDRKNAAICQQLQASQQALRAGNAAFFLTGLPERDHVRLFPHLRHHLAFLDIETAGLAPDAPITTIAVYQQKQVRFYVHGVNLDQFAPETRDVGTWVTYNGTRFDLPRLHRHLGGSITGLHLDLCPILHAWGYYGGLKSVERKLGIRRQVAPATNGEYAAGLWQHFEEEGRRDALCDLLNYNLQDTLTLEVILVKLYNRAMAGCPMLKHPLAMPQQPCLPLPMPSLFENRKTLPMVVR